MHSNLLCTGLGTGPGLRNNAVSGWMKERTNEGKWTAPGHSVCLGKCISNSKQLASSSSSDLCTWELAISSSLQLFPPRCFPQNLRWGRGEPIIQIPNTTPDCKASGPIRSSLAFCKCSSFKGVRVCLKVALGIGRTGSILMLSVMHNL